MAADLHIHIMNGLVLSDLEIFFSNTLGSKYFRPTAMTQSRESIFRKIQKTPNISIGEVSWLKASMSGEPDTYVPSTVMEIYQAIGEDLPVLDEVLKGRILGAFSLPNSTGYRLAEGETVAAFLSAHMGERLFTVSW